MFSLRKFRDNQVAAGIITVMSEMAIGLAITIIVVSRIFSAGDTSIDENDTEAVAGFTSVKSYFWVAVGLVGLLLIVIAGKQIMENL